MLNVRPTKILDLKERLPPAHGLQFFLQSKPSNGRPNQLVLTRLCVPGIFESFKQNALTDVFLADNCLKLTPELDGDVSLLTSSPPNVVVLDVLQEALCLVAVLVSEGAEHSLEDMHCVVGRHKW